MNLSEQYIYNDPIETTLNNMLLFDPEGRIGFSDIMKSLKDHGIFASNNKVGSI